MENRHLLISDVDGTLLGNDEGLCAFAEWFEPRRDAYLLAYNSGRLVDSVLESVAATKLPEPDAIIGGVGTEIRTFGRHERVTGWPDPDDGWRPLEICSLLAEYDLQLQPAELLSDFKISYFVHEASQELLDSMQRRLIDASCAVEMVYSSSRDLDVLPAGVNKGTAAAHLATQWGFDHADVIVAGDTGNDRAMFENGFRGVVVENAHDELKALRSETTYLAKQDHAAGVLEGVLHWFGTAADR